MSPWFSSWGLSALYLLSSLSSLPLTNAHILDTRSSVTVNVLVEFGEFTWAENLAIRSNGQILVSRLDTPLVLQVDPTGTRDPIEVASFSASEHMGCLGISETCSDVFYVITSAIVNSSFVKTSGVNSIYEIDMNTFELSSTGEVVSNATVTKLVDITSADFLNGMTTLDSTHILVGDIYNGWVYKVNTESGAYSIVINDSKMKFTSVANPATNLGVNGLKILDDYLYWTNTAAGTFNKIKITSSGTPAGSSSTVVSNVPRADDFIFNCDDVAFIAQNQEDELSILYPSASAAKVIAGSNTSTILAGVSAGKFGRLSNDSNILYLTTSGGLALPINGSITVPGTVSWIDTSSL